MKRNEDWIVKNVDTSKGYSYLEMLQPQGKYQGEGTHT